ncbi:MAG: hypothetical protein QW456_11275 [Ignisphaera sp.]
MKPSGRMGRKPICYQDPRVEVVVEQKGVGIHEPPDGWPRDVDGLCIKIGYRLCRGLQV